MLTYSTNDNRDNPISLSEVYCNIFHNTKNILDIIGIKRYTYKLIIRLMHTFLTLDVSLLFVTLMISGRVPSQFCFYKILSCVSQLVFQRIYLFYLYTLFHEHDEGKTYLANINYSTMWPSGTNATYI